MSAGNIITALQKLIKLHKSLNNLAQRKTNIIKEGDMDALSQLLMDEQKHIKAIEFTENERERAVQSYLLKQGQELNTATISDVIEISSDKEKAQLEALKAQLLEEAHMLKDHNYLNQQLIYQSLQFVNLTLDMLRPSNQNFNYEKPVQQKHSQASSGMFDSKA
ncbi:flagellar protein FlgN [Actinomycetes bacterium NPDC127524]